MTLIRYFAYGSNMLTDRLQARCPSARARCVARTEGFRLSFCKKSQDGSGKATLASCASGHVYGVVFDLDESDLPTLDRLEGVGRSYDRIDDFPVRCEGLSGMLDVVTYIAGAGFTGPDLKPYDWYLNLVIVGARQHALPPEYVSAIAAMPSIDDPKADRPSRLEAMELLGKIRS